MRNENIKEVIISFMVQKLPNSIRIRKVHETLKRNQKLNLSDEEIEVAIKELVSEKKIKINTRSTNPTHKKNMKRELKKRDSVELVNPPEVPISSTYMIKDTEVVRLLAGDIVSAEDINEVAEALKEYVEQMTGLLMKEYRKRQPRYTSR